MPYLESLSDVAGHGQHLPVMHCCGFHPNPEKLKRPFSQLTQSGRRQHLRGRPLHPGPSRAPSDMQKTINRTQNSLGPLSAGTSDLLGPKGGLAGGGPRGSGLAPPTPSIFQDQSWL